MLKRYYKKIFLTIVIMFSCLACSIMPSDEKLNNIDYIHQQVPSVLHNKAILESLVFKALGDKKLLTQLEFGVNNMNMVAMSYSGLPIIQAKWNRENGITELISQHFKKDTVLRIIRDIQWVKWPVDSIRNGFKPLYSINEFHDEKNNAVRQIEYQNKPIVKITYFEDKIILMNSFEKYELIIEQLNDK